MHRTVRAWSLLTVLLACAAGLAACGDDRASTGDRIRVVATTTQLADFARNVAGDRADVTQLLPPNVDPHEFEPSPSDAAAIAKADLIVENGIGLDEWLDELIDGRNAPSRVVATQGLTLRPGDEGSPDGDPHVWLDPRNAVAMVRAIARGLATADASGADTYRSNADRYVAELGALDAELQGQIDRIPVHARAIVTDHDAFGYFTDRYGIRVVGTVIPSLATGAEAGAKDVDALIDTIRREKVRAVFAENSVDPALVRAIADEAGAKLGEPLYGDTLAPPGDPAGTYVGMMRANMNAIVNALR
jgi:ABC-type Zn uptake system ZnuABC Zn-binding protein ZnuA